MMSRTGNRPRAFTLIEIMVTTVVLSLGAVLIYEIFFRSLDLINYCNDYLKIAPWADEKLWQAQDELTHTNTAGDQAPSGSCAVNGKEFNWKLERSYVGGYYDLYKIDLSIAWREGRKIMGFSRNAYALYVEKQK